METELSKHPKHVSDSKLFPETNLKIRKIGTKILTLPSYSLIWSPKEIGRKKKKKKLETGFLTTKRKDYFFIKKTQFTDFKTGFFH